MADRFQTPIDLPVLSVDPPSPSVGYVRWYSKTDGKAYQKDSSGVVTEITNEAGESPLTFSDGLTRTVDTIKNDLTTGKAGGQTVVGGTASGDDLTISSTTNGTKGNINFGTSTYDEVNNKLGIGTTSPAKDLTIEKATSSTLRLSATNDPANYYSDIISAYDGANSFRIQHGGVDLFHATQQGYGAITVGNGGSKLVLKPVTSDAYFDGKLGIGTASPSSTLHVNGNGLRISDSAAGRDLIIEPSLGGAVHTFKSSNTAAGYAFTNNSSEFMRITAAGLVGIGTTSPSEKLDVAGSINGYNLNQKIFSVTIPTTVGNAIDIATVTNTNFSSNVELWFTVHNSSYAQSKKYIIPVAYDGTAGAWHKCLPISTTGAYSGNDAEIDVKVSAAIATFRVRRTQGSTAGTASISLAIGGDPQNTTITASSTTYTGATVSANYAPTSITMKNGNAGIGTDSPSDLLSLYNTTAPTIRQGTPNYTYQIGPIADDGVFHIKRNDGVVADRFVIANNGNVGIGLTIPTSKLDVRADYAPGANVDALQLSTTGHGGNVSDAISLSFEATTTPVARIQSVVSSGSYDLAFQTGATISEKMRIMANGNVGIGTTSPTTKLDVNGTGNFAGDVTVPDEAYGIGWNGSLEVPTKNAIYDKIETISTTSILQAVYPVGSIYISVVSTNPATLFGFGTWVAFAEGRTLVGIDTGQTEFDTVEETGGAKTHTLTTSEMPAHTHGIRLNGGGTSTNSAGTYSAGNVGSTTERAGNLPTASEGSGAAHNNLQPYIVTYMWKRTA